MHVSYAAVSVCQEAQGSAGPANTPSCVRLASASSDTQTHQHTELMCLTRMPIVYLATSVLEEALHFIAGV